MPHPTLYTTDRSPFHQGRALAAAPSELAITMLQHPDREELLLHLAMVEYWVSERVGEIDAELLKSAPNLKLILRLGSMTYDIDLEAARAAGVIVCTWPDAGANAVAEHIVLQMLALIKKLREVEAIAREASPQWGTSRRTDENTFAYNWSGRQHIGTLRGRTVGILGFGEIGSELARRLQGWGCTLLYHKRSRLPESLEAELKLTYADEAALRSQSDVVVNLLPYAADTINRIDAAWLAAMKQGSMLVSCGSGGTIDEFALAAAVEHGHLAGAAVDSYTEEPLPTHNPLVTLARQGANILLTPHTAAGNGRPRSEEYTDILRHLRGEPLLNRLI